MARKSTATVETQKQMQFLIQRTQTENKELEIFKEDCSVCKGRIHVEYPVYLPENLLLSEMVVMQAHLKTLHEGVGLTMSKVREEY